MKLGAFAAGALLMAFSPGPAAAQDELEIINNPLQSIERLLEAHRLDVVVDRRFCHGPIPS